MFLAERGPLFRGGPIGPGLAGLCLKTALQPRPQIQPPYVSGYANTPYSRSSHSWHDGRLPEGYPDLFSSAHLPPVSHPNTIHHSRLNVCLIDYLDLTPCLSIVFWLSACE